MLTEHVNVNSHLVFRMTLEVGDGTRINTAIIEDGQVFDGVIIEVDQYNDLMTFINSVVMGRAHRDIIDLEWLDEQVTEWHIRANHAAQPTVIREGETVREAWDREHPQA